MTPRPMLPPRAVLAALALTLAACSEPRRPNVLFVVVDTLRADRVGKLGQEEGMTPYLQRFAAGATRFEACHSHAPWTLPSCAALLSGRHPAEHGAGGSLAEGMRRLADGVQTLPGVFGAAGYATHAIVNVAFLGEEFGVTREFGSLDAVHFNSNTEVRRAEPTTDAALRWLGERAHEEPFFLFVHYFDPHAVYDPPQPFRRNFAEPEDRDDDSWVFGTRQHMMALRAGQLRLDERTLTRAEALYDGEVAYTDAAVGRLLDGLAAAGLAEETVVVITGDHGEEFGDHGGFEHGHTLFDELTHVPLLVRAPGYEPGVVPTDVRHVDLAPTLCELADLAPASGFVGRSLVPGLAGAALEARPVLAQGNMWGPALTSWREGGWKLVREPGRDRLFHVAQDPGELRDRAGDSAADLQRLVGGLERALAGFRALASGAEVAVDGELLEWMQQMGYAGGGER